RANQALDKVPEAGRRPASKRWRRVSRVRRRLWRDQERRRFLRLRRFRRCTGRLNATQPGVLAVSTSYIRGLGAACKGRAREPEGNPLLERRGAATLAAFHRFDLKVD